MRFFWRRRVEDTKESALAEARRATRSLRRRKADVERYRAGKQSAPIETMTANQWIAGGS